MKRTSAEAEKAFAAAVKEFGKHHLKELLEKNKKNKTHTTDARKTLVENLKKIDGKKWHLKAKALNKKIGRLDAHLAQLDKDHARFTQHAKDL